MSSLPSRHRVDWPSDEIELARKMMADSKSDVCPFVSCQRTAHCPGCKQSANYCPCKEGRGTSCQCEEGNLKVSFLRQQKIKQVITVLQRYWDELGSKQPCTLDELLEQWQKQL
jgi:hypothetical protein